MLLGVVLIFLSRPGVATSIPRHIPTLVVFLLPFFYLHSISLIVLLPLPFSCTRLYRVIFPSWCRIVYCVDGAEIKDATTTIDYEEGTLDIQKSTK